MQTFYCVGAPPRLFLESPKNTSRKNTIHCKFLWVNDSANLKIMRRRIRNVRIR